MTRPVPLWDRIPYELQARRQWLLAAADSKGALKVPSTLTSDGRVIGASHTDPAAWLDFATAASAAWNLGLGIGYCINAIDPYACIDLDVKGAHNEPDQSKWTTSAQFNRFWLITQAFDTYTEHSSSGFGLHIWVRALAADGARHEGVEVYSQARFMVCTGNVLFDKPIAERQDLLDTLVGEIRRFQGATRKVSELDERGDQETDEVILERAAKANNEGKYNELYAGRWQQFGYPSQSEADLALLSMYTFYSRSNEQCRRLFRTSALGKREKAQKDDRYLDYTLKLIRGRQAQEDQAKEKEKLITQHFFQSEEQRRREAEEIRAYAASLGPANAPQGADVLTPDPAAQSAQDALPATAVALLPPPPAQPADDPSLSWPPGLVGALAGFFYRNAPRPVKEVAIVAALGLMAGVCGKMWNIPGSGLNLYIILVARSAIGKEAMHSGIGTLLAKLRETTPAAQNFVDFNDFASGPALIKACAANPCFVNVAGEWGRKLKRMSADGERDGPIAHLRTAMTNLYQKSGPASVVGGLTYSNKDNNVASVSGVSYSMIGETTPDTFYESLTESMMADGFLSRFTVIEYTGKRPPTNMHPEYTPNHEMCELLLSIMIHASSTAMNRQPPVQVMRDAEAAELMQAFDRECDDRVNGTNDEAWRQMWNRAHLKMLRIAALLAIGDNYLTPIITGVHIRWALEVIRRDIAIMARKIESGDIGTGDGVRERKLVQLMRDFFAGETGEGYHIPEGVKDAGIIPRSYLQVRTSRLAIFTTARNGATKALDEALKSICDSGYVMEIDRKEGFDLFATKGRLFRVLTLPDYSKHV